MLEVLAVVRNTLSWDACDNCGWRGATSECMLGGRRVRLCPYCYMVLSSSGVLECKRPIIRLRSSSTSTSRLAVRSFDVNEALIEELSSTSKPEPRPASRSRRAITSRRARRKS